MKFKGKIVVVTGAANGIGLGIARAFAEEGATVCGVDCDADALQMALSQLPTLPGQLHAYIADVSSESAVASCVTRILGDQKQIDVLINNAGINMTKDITALTTADWHRVVDVNLSGVYLLCKHVWKHFLARRSGVIINVSSIMGLVGGVQSPAYCSTKAAVCMLTRCLAKDGARHGIRINAICPGYIDTPAMHAYIRTTPDPDATWRALVDAQPMGRVGTPRDVANCTLFLASDDASYISGVSLPIDGGLTATQID